MKKWIDEVLFEVEKLSKFEREKFLKNELLNLYKILEYFVEPTVIDNLLREKSIPIPKKNFVVVGFCDIRGFTSFSEKNPPKIVFEILNNVAQITEDIVEKYSAVVDKYIGDSSMILWHNIGDFDFSYKLNVVKATIELTRKLNNVLNKYNLGVGTAINCGESLLGFVGSKHMLDFTVIGDVVNVASRLQAEARKGEIILPLDFKEAVKALELNYSEQEFYLKGKTTSVQALIVTVNY